MKATRVVFRTEQSAAEDTGTFSSCAKNAKIVRSLEVSPNNDRAKYFRFRGVSIVGSS